MTGPCPETCALLKRNGIDPTNVAIDGFGHSGYFVFVRNSSGDKVLDYSSHSMNKEFRQWPSVDLAKRVMDMFTKEEEKRQ